MRICLTVRVGLGLALLTPASSSLLAQAVPTAIQQASLVAGIEGSNFTPDFAPNRMTGIGGYADIDWRKGLGVEAEARFLEWNSFYGETQRTYLIGPRAFLFPSSRWRPYGKLLVGGGKMTFPFSIGQGSYFVLAPGVGVDYLLSHHWRLRADYEFQVWPSAPGVKGEPNPSPLHPNGVSVGVAYRIR